VRFVGFVPDAGWLGVDLFFVLSGFLITRQLLALRATFIDGERRDARAFFKTFYVRRVARIFPHYFVYLAVVFVILPRLVDEIGSGDGIALDLADPRWFVTFLPNFLFAHHADFVGGRHLAHLWSLGVEEQFYLVWPLFVLVLDRRALAVASAVLVVVAVAARFYYDAAGASWIASFVLPHCRMDALLLGALVAQRPPRTGALAVALAVLAGAIFFALVVENTGGYLQFSRPVATVGLTVHALVFALVVARVLEAKDARLARALSWRPLAFIGRHSYGIYVWHIVVEHYLAAPLTRWPPFRALDDRLLQQACFTLVATALAVAVAAALHVVIERPFLRWRARVA
jgi:peptidoglycan/LPS O-acetylase OafA/YrhL